MTCIFPLRSISDIYSQSKIKATVPEIPDDGSTINTLLDLKERLTFSSSRFWVLVQYK